MQTLSSQDLKKTSLQACAVCIGGFDGMHLGHQALLNATLQAAQKENIKSALLSFNPSPKAFFKPNHNIAQLMTFEEKKHYLTRQGFDYFICLDFNQKLADQSANDFVKLVLHQQLSAKVIITGPDFHFGHHRQGDSKLLTALSQSHPFELIQPEIVQHEHKKIGSTWVRQALADGDLHLARTLLGRHYSMEGTVKKGDQRGRTLGFPTANIQVGRNISPLHGVFVINAEYTLDGAIKKYNGVANIGMRPTVDGTRLLLEAHLFNCNADLYHQHLKINFLHKIRSEERYDSIEKLVAQIHKDVAEAHSWLKNNSV